VCDTTFAPFVGIALRETAGGTKDRVAWTRWENLSENIVYREEAASHGGTGTPKSHRPWPNSRIVCGKQELFRSGKVKLARQQVADACRGSAENLVGLAM